MKDKPRLTDIAVKTDTTVNIGHRPTDYKSEYSDIAERLVAAGFSTNDLAFAFNVNPRTITNWKKRNPEFKRACNNGKDIVKKKLVASGIKQALGYDYKSSKTVDKLDRTGKPVTEKTTFIQHQTGNYQMLQFLLLNIARQDGTNDWVTPKQIIETKNQTISLKIDGKLASDAIDRLAGKLLEVKPTKQIESKEVEDRYSR